MPNKNEPDEQKHMKIQRFTRSLKIALKPEEVASRADRAAHLISDRDEKAEEAKAASAHLKAQIKEIEAELRNVSNEVRSKTTWGPVPCERRYDFRLGEVRVVRLDTQETVEGPRPMTDLERQMELEGTKFDDEDDAPESEPEPLPTQKGKGRKKKPTEESASP